DKYDSIAQNLNLKKTYQRGMMHYFHVQTHCALNAGMYKQTMQLADRCRKSAIPDFLNAPAPFGNYSQYIYMTPVIALVRLGKWQEILSASEPDNNWTYACLLNDFAKGLAFIHTGNIDAAKRCLDSLQAKLKYPVLTVRNIPFNAPIKAATIAEKILQGEILFSEKKIDDAIISFKEAVAIEDDMIYREPKEWPIPSRQFLGAYLIKANKLVEAEKIYREDLELNPNNGWSLFGLYQSLEQQHKYREAKEYKEKYLQAFSNADTEPVASVF
ncbi:MAG TPA: hypothetical protein VN958_13460, partial [Chitinophagaceae bacterium]|nr:hypothetical protein [Chitinophagaceae bacterium]